MRAQTANPGGILAPEEIVGRDELTARLWRVLERQSLYLTAERRMGKTSIVRDKMGQAPPEGWKMIYLDASIAASPLQFVEAILNASRSHMDRGKRIRFVYLTALKSLSGIDLSAGVGVKLPEHLGPDWKTLLQTLLRDLAACETRIVIAFDELPVMFDAIRRIEQGAGGEVLVMELLNTLRAARQEHKKLRMLYTGSLGLHHVLTVLREQRYQNDSTNDMRPIDLEPLAQEDATELARRLFAGEKIVCDDMEITAAHLARATDGIAFYIQNVVAEIALDGRTVTTEGIDRCLKEFLTDPLDRWGLNYYVERIDTHYPMEYRPIARALLDQLAEGSSKTPQELTEAIDPAKIERDEETTRKVTALLGLDHYIAGEDGKFGFRLPFIRRIWRNRRGMGD